MAVTGSGPHGAGTVGLHLTMRDGVRIAVDVSLPPQARGERVTTALRVTRYWRRGVGDPLREERERHEIERFLAQGMALAVVDSRGTGASFGHWSKPWSGAEVEDVGEIIDWIAQQPWSDGMVCTHGVSYDGTAAQLAATTGRRALRLVVPRFSLLDPYAHIAFPGGVPLVWFLRAWASGNRVLDGFPDDPAAQYLALPILGSLVGVDADADGSLLAAAQSEHAANLDIFAATRDVLSRDEIVGTDGQTLDSCSPLGRIDEMRAFGVPQCVTTSWFDGGYAASGLGLLGIDGIPSQVVIGPWAHGARFGGLGSPFAPEAPLEPSPTAQLDEIAEIMLHCAHSDALPEGPRLRYYTLAEEVWHSSDHWPPPGVAAQRWHLHRGGTLSRDTPVSSDVSEHVVDFEASTGPSNRWHSLIGGVPVVYPDRREADRRLLVFDSEPLGVDLEVTGTPAVGLRVRVSRDDGAVFVYLEDVDAAGSVTYVTEGMLRLLHRRLSPEPGPYPTYGPRHTFHSRDVEPVVPAEWMSVQFTLFPTSVLFRAGHRLRVAIAGADADSFARIPRSGGLRLDIAHGSLASWVDLPVRTR